jgi:hypothetical protein
VTGTPPIFTAEGTADCPDHVTGRNVSLWLHAVLDDTGHPSVYIDAVEMITNQVELPDHDNDQDEDLNNPYRSEGTILRARYRLTLRDAEKTARGLIIAAFVADQHNDQQGPR